MVKPTLSNHLPPPLETLQTHDARSVCIPLDPLCPLSHISMFNDSVLKPYSRHRMLVCTFGATCKLYG